MLFISTCEALRGETDGAKVRRRRRLVLKDVNRFIDPNLGADTDAKRIVFAFILSNYVTDD